MCRLFTICAIVFTTASLAADEFRLETVRVKKHNPQSDAEPVAIHLIASGKRLLVADHADNQPVVIPRAEYRERDVPKSAVFAFAWWWAGGGEEFYVTQNASSVHVFGRWREEEEVKKPSYKLRKQMPRARQAK